MNHAHAISGGIAARIYDSFPSGTYCLPALLRVLDVVETDSVETAAIECKAVPRLLVNPAFVAAHAETPEKLVVLVLHELHHLLLGHTRLYPRPTPLDNLAFDAVINATLAQLFPEPEYLALFTDFYDETQLLSCFLRPATDWTPTGPPVAPPALVGDGEDLEALRQVHAALYSPAGVTYDEIRRALERVLWLASRKSADSATAEDLPLLLGDHRDEAGAATSSSGGLEQRSPALLATVRDIVERWPPPPTPMVGRSLSEFVHSFDVRPEKASPQLKLRRLFRRIAGEGGGTSLSRNATAPTQVNSAVPRASRRGVVLAALGAAPLLHEHSIEQRRRSPAGERVHVYLDVSGSLKHLLPELYGAVLSCRELVHPVIHTFSTVVADLALADLKLGKVATTNGTDIACVAEHLRTNRIRRAVIVTDGYVGRPGELDRRVLRKTRLGVALTRGNVSRDDLAGVVDAWSSLEP